MGLVLPPGQLPGSPAALSLVPGLSPTCPLPKCGVALELQIPSETLQLALFIPKSGTGPRTIGGDQGKGKGTGQSWPLPMAAWQKYCQRELWRMEKW